LAVSLGTGTERWRALRHRVQAMNGCGRVATQGTFITSLRKHSPSERCCLRRQSKILLDHDDASDEKRQYHEIERSQAIIGPHWSPQSAGSLQTLAATICDDVDALG